MTDTLRERHQPVDHTAPSDDRDTECLCCRQPWPCDTIRALDHADELRHALDELHRLRGQNLVDLAAAEAHADEQRERAERAENEVADLRFALTTADAALLHSHAHAERLAAALREYLTKPPLDYTASDYLVAEEALRLYDADHPKEDNMPDPDALPYPITEPKPGYEFIERRPCKGCRADIYWWLTTNGKRSPHDADGTSHFATCPEAEQFRRRR